MQTTGHQSRPAGQPAGDATGPDEASADQASTGGATFRRAAEAFAAGRERERDRRDGFQVEEFPAPKRLAPHAAALAATVGSGDAEIASGRLVLLYDPAGQDGWAGQYRFVGYLQADMDPEIASDPLLSQVCWSWLTEALHARTPGYAAMSGTVTRVSSEGFGGKAAQSPSHDCELRASWSPVIARSASFRAGRTGDGDVAAAPCPTTGADDPADLDLAAHVAAWCDCLGAAAGLPPLPDDVAALPHAGTRAARPRHRPDRRRG